jgi:hypothetical protein
MLESTGYEKFVKRMLEEMLESSILVHHCKGYVGKISGRKIIIDVSFEMEVVGGAKLLFLIECKRYNDKVKVEDVEEFYSKLDDIGAHKGIFFTTVGYQDGAVKTARGRGIALALLTDKPQKGELKFITNVASNVPSQYCSDKFLQGNLKPMDDLLRTDHEGGFRFESFGQLLSVLYLNIANKNKGMA